MPSSARSRPLRTIPPGVQQYGLAEVRRRRGVEATLTAVLRGWSYEEVILPILDYEEVFGRSVGDTGSGRMYRLIDPEGHIVGVRPDLTPLAAKLVATGLRRESLPIRVFYSGEVVRPQGPKALGQGEFHQIGFEQVGGDPAPGDLEVAVVALEALKASGLRSFRMLLSHSGVLPAMAAQAGLHPQQAVEIERCIDRRQDRALKASLAGARVTARHRKAFRALTKRVQSPEQMVRWGREAGPAVERHLQVLARLWEDLRDLGYGDRVGVDLGEVGGLGYYTGVRFRAYAEGVGFAIGSGGRYDTLLEQFGTPQPAVGFSFSLDRLLRALECTGGAPVSGMTPSCAVPVGGHPRRVALRKALDLFHRGRRVRLC